MKKIELNSTVPSYTALARFYLYEDRGLTNPTRKGEILSQCLEKERVKDRDLIEQISCEIERLKKVVA